LHRKNSQADHHLYIADNKESEEDQQAPMTVKAPTKGFVMIDYSTPQIKGAIKT
jgi:hypothetical protein